MEEEDIPMPLNSAYSGVVHGHHGVDHHVLMTYHHHQQNPPPPSSHDLKVIPSSEIPSNNHNGSPMQSNNNGMPSNNSGMTPNKLLEETNNSNHSTKVNVNVRYRECQKNHAANMGGKATDGCGEFMPSGEEGSLEALICSACNCHRNFHRKEIDGANKDTQIAPHYHHFYHPSSHHMVSSRGRKFVYGANNGVHQGLVGYPAGVKTVPILPYQVGSTLSDDHSDEYATHHSNGGMMVMRPSQSDHHQLVKKRYRTKFTQEQKEKMLEFAERVGWKIQKQEETVVQQFCQEVGVKRRVLKVWMHNNKHTLAKKNPTNNNNNDSSTMIE